MATPRKFSEKIALHNQKQAEETAAFERIMQEVSVTRVMPPPRTVAHLQPHPQGYLRPYLGGSLPNVNQIAANPQMEFHHPQGFDDGKQAMRHPARFDSRMRPYAFTHRRPVAPLEMNRQRLPVDVPHGQYPGHYLSPPPESNWRSFALSRTNSDSAIHQSVTNPNPQEQFPVNNTMHDQQRHDFNENNLCNVSLYKTMLENKKFESYLQGGSRPKSCETTNISAAAVMRTGADGPSIRMCGNGSVPGVPAPLNHGLSHVTQIGNNTGSLPDLTNIAANPMLNPIDYDDPPAQQTGAGQNSPLYGQARSTSNLPAAAAISPHLAGLSRGAASPSRSRRHTHNGPSPLSLRTADHARRMKYPGATASKVAGVKPELKSPPVGGAYPYPYNPTAPQGTGWPLPSPEHPGSPSHGQIMSPHGLSQTNSGPVHQHHMTQQPSGTPLRIDVSAASKIGQQMSPYTRARQGTSVTSPLTSPASPTSQCSQASFSPITSPRHEFTTGSNPALSEAYYRTDMSSMRPLQQQFEHYLVMGDNSSPQHQTGVPPTYSALTALSENAADGGFDQGQSGSLFHTMPGGSNVSGKNVSHLSNNINRIPDIVFTGAEDPHPSKMAGLLGTNDFSGVAGHDLSSEYFPGDDLKANLGLEELQMLDEPNIIHDPAMEDSLQLDSM